MGEMKTVVPNTAAECPYKADLVDQILAKLEKEEAEQEARAKKQRS